MKVLVEHQNVHAIYFGGAPGADTEALQAALHYRTAQTPQLICCVPDTLQRQPASTHPWSLQADQLIELNNPITAESGYQSFRTRNQYLVDHASRLVAFFSGNYRSGTGHAILLAQKAGIPVHTINLRD